MNLRAERGNSAFSRLDLLACVLVVGIVGAIVLPALASSHTRNDRLRCFNNLRQIANALRHFALEHENFPPWRAQAGEGGNFNQPGKHELWFQYWWLRDSIKNPRILMDPGETRANARAAANWDLGPEGLMTYKNNAVAYILGLDSTTYFPQSLLVADRHLSDVGISSCSSGINTASRLLSGPGGVPVHWLNEVHGPFGNLALADGSVVAADTDALRRILRSEVDGVEETHVLKPGW